MRALALPAIAAAASGLALEVGQVTPTTRRDGATGEQAFFALTRKVVEEEPAARMAV
jgi:hypothetical protein